MAIRIQPSPRPRGRCFACSDAPEAWAVTFDCGQLRVTVRLCQLCMDDLQRLTSCVLGLASDDANQ